MKILRYKKKKDNRYEVVMSDKNTYILYDDIILKYELLLKKDIDDKELSTLLKENEELEGYYKVIKYISIKMRCKKEIIKYLKDYSSAVVGKIIKRLEHEGLLNDKDYVRSYVNDCINLSNKGYYKILRELSNLDINEDIIKEYLDTISDDVWVSRINKIIKKKLSVSKGLSNSKLRDKLIYDLSNLGYSKIMVIDVMDGFIFGDDSDNLKKDYKKIKMVLERKYSGRELEAKLLTKLLSRGYKYNDIEELKKESF